MKTLHLVVTENCELCEKGLKTITLLNKFFKKKKFVSKKGIDCRNDKANNTDLFNSKSLKV